MDTLAIFGLHLVLSLIVYALIAKWFVSPWLAEKPIRLASNKLLRHKQITGQAGGARIAGPVQRGKLGRVFRLEDIGEDYRTMEDNTASGKLVVITN